ncbi:DinB family protein [Ekhidna sp. To15]|uniref:DinB family protein n=1 Tax=Ekhidna sp. To15 TaxID=3395267 RepID=UPI003F52629F
MKKIGLAVICTVIVVASIAQTTISNEERKKALTHLKKTQNELTALVQGLNEIQMNFKPDESVWSIAECLEHIAISEKNLIEMIKGGLQGESDPARRSEVAMSDEQILALITSREQKVKTRKEFEPTNSFGGSDGTLKTFKERRKSNMKFLKSTDADLRNHYLQFPFGLLDVYQGVLFMSGHTQRHTDQIKEIMESDNFPS